MQFIFYDTLMLSTNIKFTFCGVDPKGNNDYLVHINKFDFGEDNRNLFRGAIVRLTNVPSRRRENVRPLPFVLSPVPRYEDIVMQAVLPITLSA